MNTEDPHKLPVDLFILNQLKFSLARDAESATPRDWWIATSKAVQSIIIERMITTQTVHHHGNVKRVYYLSLEFLMGRLFVNSMYSAGIFKDVQYALGKLGLDMDTLRREEYDMGLGNGGLGRLAACYWDEGRCSRGSASQAVRGARRADARWGAHGARCARGT